jgi:hypothetical protein
VYNLATTGFSTVIYAVTGIVAVAGGIIAKVSGRRNR